MKILILGSLNKWRILLELNNRFCGKTVWLKWALCCIGIGLKVNFWLLKTALLKTILIWCILKWTFCVYLLKLHILIIALKIWFERTWLKAWLLGIELAKIRLLWIWIRLENGFVVLLKLILIIASHKFWLVASSLLIKRSTKLLSILIILRLKLIVLKLTIVDLVLRLLVKIIIIIIELKFIVLLLVLVAVVCHEIYRLSVLLRILVLLILVRIHIGTEAILIVLTDS